MPVQLEKKISVNGIMSEDSSTVILTFTVINTIFVPSIPLLPLIFGVPVIILLLFMITGKRINVPNIIGKRSIREKTWHKCHKVVNKISFIASNNRMSRLFAEEIFMKFFCIVGILLTSIMCLPIPVINTPCALCMVLIAMGFMRNDGLLSFIGATLGIFAIIITIFTLMSLFNMADYGDLTQ